MLSNVLRTRTEIQEKIVDQTALGQDIDWIPIWEVYCRKIPLDVRTIAAYQQMNTIVTDKIILNGKQEINLGKHRFVISGDIYEPQSSAQHLGNSTVVIVRRV